VPLPQLRCHTARAGTFVPKGQGAAKQSVKPRARAVINFEALRICTWCILQINVLGLAALALRTIHVHLVHSHIYILNLGSCRLVRLRLWHLARATCIAPGALAGFQFRSVISLDLWLAHSPNVTYICTWCILAGFSSDLLLRLVRLANVHLHLVHSHIVHNRYWSLPPFRTTAGCL